MVSLMPFLCRWDSCQIGFYVITEEKAKEHELYNKMIQGAMGTYTDDNFNEELCKDMCEHELKLFNQYIDGEVYEYTYNDGEDDEERVGGYFDLDDILHQFKGMEIVK
jgi:hypothetical protein